VRDARGARTVVSPFLPAPDVVSETLAFLSLPATDDPIENEIQLSAALDYEPMFMTDCTGLIFPWQVDEAQSDDQVEVSVIPTPNGEWVRRVPRRASLYGDEAAFPVRTEADHDMILSVCEQIGQREAHIREYFRQWRQKVGEDGVIVIGHPHAAWLAHQIAPQNMVFHWHDYRSAYRRSMDAICEAALFIMDIAIEEGVDFMSDASYGLEMTSPELFELMDLPYIQTYSDWTHSRGGLFWFHCCSRTRRLILDGVFNRLGADIIETVAPPPEGDNDIAESRRYIDATICTKGNLNLGLLRDGSPDEVVDATRRLIAAVRDFPHIFSTADAVLPGTPPENLIAFVETCRRVPDTPA
jgi:uroporphyrinogen-III decarboxylase